MLNFFAAIRSYVGLLTLSLPLCALAMQSADAAAEFFVYKVDAMPAGTLSCQQEASNLALRFAQATGIKPFKSECVSQQQDRYTLALTYVAPKQLRPVIAHFDLMGSDPNGSGPMADNPLAGIYPSFEDCGAGAPAKISEFERETALRAVAAYCYASMMGSYVLRIDGFGVPAKNFFQFEGEFKGKIDQSFLQALATVIKSHGNQIAHATSWDSGAFVMYYGQQALNLAPKTIGTYGMLRNPQQCANELAEVNRLLAEIGGQRPAAEACLSDSLGGGTFINFVFEASQSIDWYWELPGPVYGSYEGCVADRARVAQQVRENNHVDARGTICVLARDNASAEFQSVVLGK